MKIKYNQETNKLTIDLGDTIEFETKIHEFDEETVLAITMQKNENSLVAQLKRTHPVKDTAQARSLREYLTDEDDS